MKVGDLVKLKSRTRFTAGETLDAGEVGVIIKQSYLAYDPDDNKWLVLFKDEMRSVKQARMTKVNDEGER
tara:strand:+ start:424 stop:633 length:210 start_codon:yes stop_codon:yes gene_type:complete